MRDSNNTYEINRELDRLSEQYEIQLKKFGLPLMCAEELIHAVQLTPEQSRYVTEFIETWDRVWDRLARAEMRRAS